MKLRNSYTTYKVYLLLTRTTSEPSRSFQRLGRTLAWSEGRHRPAHWLPGRDGSWVPALRSPHLCRRQQLQLDHWKDSPWYLPPCRRWTAWLPCSRTRRSSRRRVVIIDELKRKKQNDFCYDPEIEMRKITHVNILPTGSCVQNIYMPSYIHKKTNVNIVNVKHEYTIPFDLLRERGL